MSGIELKKGALLGTDNQWVQYYEAVSVKECWIFDGYSNTQLSYEDIKPVPMSVGLYALNFKPEIEQAVFPRKWRLNKFEVLEKSADAFFIDDTEVKHIILIQEAFNLYKLIPRNKTVL